MVGALALDGWAGLGWAGGTELKLKQVNSQLKKAELVAADHDELITKHHQLEIKHRLVEEEKRASGPPLSALPLQM